MKKLRTAIKNKSSQNKWLRGDVVGLALSLLLSVAANGQGQENYTPTPGNLAARSDFENMRYGLFVHWGVFSMPGDGEWVMNNRNIHVEDYKRQMHGYYPAAFNAEEWVTMAKNAGMKYITFITRHHDGFSNWDSKFTDWKVTNTPYGKDVLKLLADECHRQGIKLFVYYSLLDWSRDDYPWQTGRTGQGTGRTKPGDYAHYLEFMKNQLTELLTNYGEIAGVWFDGHWDQTAPEGAADRTPRINWHYDEIYSLIHRLQPNCLIGNNHHLTPFPGEDFQMFERDLPGENNAGLSFVKPVEDLPLETCETMNNSWGYNITDRHYKSVKQVIHLLVGAAGRNANLLLNVGPMASGKIQPEFTDTLLAAGKWLAAHGNTIYGTKGRIIPPQPWGVITQRDNFLYVHLLQQIAQPYIFIPNFPSKVVKAADAEGRPVRFRQQPEGLFIYLDHVEQDPIDTIITLTAHS